jgi:hypothetical protein
VQKGDEHGIETYRVGEWVSSDNVEVVDTLYRRLSLVVVGSAPRRWLEFEYEPSCARIRSRCALPLLLPLLLLLPGSLLSAPFVINQPQTSDKRHLSCSHHTTHPSNTTSSSFIEISPSVLSCVHGRSILSAQLRRFSFILRAQANSAVPPRSYLLLRTTFDTSSTLDA